MIDRRRTARELVPLLLIAALAVGFLWRMTLGGKVMLPGDLLLLMEPWRHYSRQFPEFEQVSNPILDAVQQFYPWRKYAGESLREGVVPLWNPHELCGNPFVGNNQSAVFYPETWLHALMPTEWALGWSTALYFLLTGSLTYWFLRIVQLRRSAALLGAVAFMFNGFIIGWLCFPSFRSVPGWLPGMLVGCEMCVRRKHMGWAAISALCIGMQFLAGNLHISMIVLIVFAAYVAVRSAGAWLSGERKAALVAVGGALVATVVGGLLAAAQLLPALELAGMSSRAGGITYAGVLKHAIAPSYLLAALMPDLFGNPVDYNHWGGELGQTYRAYTETAWYVGVAPLLLAPAAFWRRPRSQTWFWAAMLLVGIALAMGTPLYALVYYLVPGAKSLSGLGRSILISSTALAVLGALGLDVLLHRAEEDAAAVRKYAWRAGLALRVPRRSTSRHWELHGPADRAVRGVVRRRGACHGPPAMAPPDRHWQPRRAPGTRSILLCRQVHAGNATRIPSHSGPLHRTHPTGSRLAARPCPGRGRHASHGAEHAHDRGTGGYPGLRFARSRHIPSPAECALIGQTGLPAA
jgi:hypothetical protein